MNFTRFEPATASTSWWPRTIRTRSAKPEPAASVAGLPTRVPAHYQAALIPPLELLQEGFMALTISSAFDAGNIRVVKQDGDQVGLEIVKDHKSDFYQWFYFRLAGAAGREVTLRIVNCAGSAYPHGWPDYKACLSIDREDWVRVADTIYADGVLTMRLTPPTDCVWI